MLNNLVNVYNLSKGNDISMIKRVVIAKTLSVQSIRRLYIAQRIFDNIDRFRNRDNTNNNNIPKNKIK